LVVKLYQPAKSHQLALQSDNLELWQFKEREQMPWMEGKIIK
jgi:hypothetical protein